MTLEEWLCAAPIKSDAVHAGSSFSALTKHEHNMSDNEILDLDENLPQSGESAAEDPNAD